MLILWLASMSAADASAQSAGTPSAATTTVTAPAPYLRRGDEVEQRYHVHRDRLQRFFNTFGATLDKDAPELRQAIMPPAPIPFGYQILPTLNADPPPARNASRVTLSPFSWSRTDSMIDRGQQRLSVLENRLDSATRADSATRRSRYKLIVDEYKRLVDGQKLMESTIQYNRLWQSEIARFTQRYKEAKTLQDAVVMRQALLDSLSRPGEHLSDGLKARADSLAGLIAEAIRKSATPDFVRRDHPSAHQWILSVPLYTDIVDSSFVEAARAAIENGWHVRDGEDEFRVVLEIRRVAPAQLYPNAEVPANGAHIVIPEHVKRFPADGAVLTTGGNLTYLFSRSIILGPHAIARGNLVHEFGHILGFKDAYFRGFEDGGADGYKVVEVIMGSDDDVGVPKNGRATRQHFEAILQEKRQ